MTAHLDFIKVVNNLEAWNAEVQSGFELTTSQFIMLNQFQRFQLLMQAMPHMHYHLTESGHARARKFIEQAMPQFSELNKALKKSFVDECISEAMLRAHESCSPPFIFVPKSKSAASASIMILTEDDYHAEQSHQPSDEGDETIEEMLGEVNAGLADLAKIGIDEDMAVRFFEEFVQSDRSGRNAEELAMHFMNKVNGEAGDGVKNAISWGELQIEADPEAEATQDIANEYSKFKEFCSFYDVVPNGKNLTKALYNKMGYEGRLELAETYLGEQRIIINGHGLQFVQQILHRHLDGFHPVVSDHYLAKYMGQAIEYSEERKGPPTIIIESVDSNDGNRKIFQLPREGYYIQYTED